MEDEFTKEMHSTLYISERTRKKLDAGSFWKIVGFNASESEVKEFCKKTILSYDDVMKWKEYWREIHNINTQND